MTTLLASDPSVNASATQATIPAEVKIGGKSYETTLFVAVVRAAFHGKPYDSADTDSEIGLDTPEAFANTLDVYASDPELWYEDKATYKAMLKARSESDASATPPQATPKLSAEETASVYKAGVTKIAGLIVAKYADEGERNFAIGKEAFDVATWQRSQFPDYTPSDFDKLMSDIRLDVRLVVPIKPESIRVDDWLRCHVLRTLVSDAIGSDASGQLSFFEYSRLCSGSRALSFDKKDVVGTLNAGWVDTIKGIAFDRASGARVSTDTFLERVANAEKAIAEKKASAIDPATAQANAAAKAVKDRTRAENKAKEDVTTALSDALAKKLLTGDTALSILESVAKEHKATLPPQVGFNPAKCTKADCELLASALFQAGKYNEMRALHDRLGKMIAAVDKARQNIGIQTPPQAKPDKARKATAKETATPPQAAADAA